MNPQPTPVATLAVTVHYLAMTAPPPPSARPRPAGVDGPTLVRPCPPAFYRFLYDTVGEPWLWDTRRRMDAPTLAAILADPGVAVHVVTMGGAPAGYIELDRRRQGADGSVDIAYFGLMPWATGRGIGPWLLDWAVAAAWADPATRQLTVNTCTLDHPAALPTYRKAGFHEVRREEKRTPDPRLDGTIPATAASHIPLAGG